MIKFQNEDKTLTVPSGLGNFPSNAGGGSDVTRQDVIEIVDSAITEYDAELQVDLEEIRDNVSGNTEDISALSGTTQDMRSDINDLSGATENIQSNVETISGQTSANTAQIEALSAAAEDLSATTEDIYNEVFYEEEGERYSYIGDLQDAVDEKQDALEAGDGISIDSPTISVKAGKGLYFKEDGKMEVLPGNGLAFSGNRNALSVKIGDGLAFSGDTLVADGGGGIEKVDELPATAEEGDVVWLNGVTGLTGYTITANGDNWASWPWELDHNYFNINDKTINIRGSVRIGKWTKTNDLFSYWDRFPGLIMRARRNSTDGGPVYDFIDPTGQYTITAGSDALSITTNTFSRRGSLYVYSGGKWYRKAEREIYFSTTGSSVTDLIESIWFGIEDADYDNLVIRYAPNGKDIREFKINASAFYGIDMQCSDDRGNVDSWGRLSVLNYRMARDGSISDMVGEKWIVSEDQISHPSQENIRITSTGSFPNPSEFGILSSESNMYRIYFRYGGDNGTDWSQAPLKYVWRRIESINGEDKLVYYWAVENLFINGTAYSGSWHSNEYDWNNYVTDSWAAQ